MMGKILGLYKHDQNGDVIFLKREENYMEEEEEW